MLDELAATGSARTLAPRLSIPQRHRRCSFHPPPEGTIPQTRCEPDAGVLPSGEVLDLAARAAAQVEKDIDPEALHVVALIDLLWADGAGNSLNRSISYLETAARLADHPAPVLADLAAAYLVRAEHTQNPRDLLEAIEAAERAVELDPDHGAARFNLALALDRLGLDGEAGREWERYLAIDAASGWAEEGRGRVQALRLDTGPPPPPAFGAPADDIAAWADVAPQEARLFGWDHVLGEWGAAVLRGDAATAEERLRYAGALGEALERRGGDATLADAVRAIAQSAGRSAELMALARAHGVYAEGQAAYASINYAAAGERFRSVLAQRPASDPLLRWAQMFAAAMSIAEGRMEEAERILTRLRAEVDTVRHPALAGRVAGVLGTVHLRRARYEHALRHAQEAAHWFAAAGEDEHLGGALYVAADAENGMGATVAACLSVHRALSVLRGHRRSLWLPNALGAGARIAAADGKLGAGIRILGERIEVTQRLGSPIHMAEARLARAHFLGTAQEHERAVEDIQIGAQMTPRIEPIDARRWIEADLRLASASAWVSTQPQRAAAALDTILAEAPGARPAFRRLQALVSRAEARLILADPDGATVDLESAAVLIDQQRAAIAASPLRASLLDAARTVYDRVVMLKLADGDTLAALAHLERSRAHWSVSPTATRGEPRTAYPGFHPPPGRVALDYALIGDTLLIWTVRNAGVRLVRQTIDRPRLLRTITRVRTSLELGFDAASVRQELAWLHGRLIRPVMEELGERTQLAIVADGEIAELPFAALFDEFRNRFLVEDHVLSFAASLVSLNAATRSAAARRPLLVADPAFDPHSHIGLERLRGARAEVEAIAAIYPEARLAFGTEATYPALHAGLGRSDLLHFAGHAVFDEAQPERSALILAPEPGGRAPDRMTATELERMDLRHVRLVVLSACRTLGVVRGRSGGFAGFASALLSAGVMGVVGSLWQVDDEHTRVLMSEFHSIYHEVPQGAEALRTAQLRLLRAPNPALRAPAAWAGFRYVGN